MKKKIKNLNIWNLILLIIFVVTSSVVIGDILYLFINIFKSVGYSVFGCISFIACLIVAAGLYSYFFEDEDK